MAVVTVPSFVRRSGHVLSLASHAHSCTFRKSHPDLFSGQVSRLKPPTTISAGRSHWKWNIVIHQSACCRSASSEPLFPSQPEATERFLSLDELLKEVGSREGFEYGYRDVTLLD